MNKTSMFESDASKYIDAGFGFFQLNENIKGFKWTSLETVHRVKYGSVSSRYFQYG